MIKTTTPEEIYKNCHGGKGDVLAHVLLTANDGVGDIAFMHDDILKPGVTIGEHLHKHSEIYYVADGTGELLWDGERLPVTKGHLSLVAAGHRHGIANTGTTDMRLIVVGLK